MTEGQKAAILNRLTAADAPTQQRIAEAIRDYPTAPLYDADRPVKTDAHDWAYTYVEGLKHIDMSRYLMALAHFYSDVRPVNALEVLIQTKVGIIQRGSSTDVFWAFLSQVADERCAA